MRRAPWDNVNMHHPNLMVVVAAVVVMLSGCATGTSVPSSTTTATAATGAALPGTPTSAPSSTSKPTSVVHSGRPDAVYSGDCEAMVTKGRIEELSGLAVKTWGVEGAASGVELLTGLGTFALAEHGAMYCYWYGPKIFVGLAAMPEGAVSAAADEQCGPVASGDGGDASQACGIELTTGSIRFSGFVSTPASQSSARLSAALVSELRESAIEGAVPAPDYPAGTWDPVLTCEDLEPAIDRVIPGIAAYRSGTDVLPTPAESELIADTQGELMDCVAYDPTDENQQTLLNINPLPGGAWIADELIASGGASEVELPGWDRTLVIDADASHIPFYTFSGPNVLQGVIWSGTLDDYAVALEEVAQLLDAHLR